MQPGRLYNEGIPSLAGVANAGNAIQEQQVKKILNIAIRGLSAAASSRAKHVTRTVAQAAQPAQVDYRSNAGGWN